MRFHSKKIYKSKFSKNIQYYFHILLVTVCTWIIKDLIIRIKCTFSSYIFSIFTKNVDVFNDKVEIFEINAWLPKYHRGAVNKVVISPSPWTIPLTFRRTSRWREEASHDAGYDGRRCYGKFKVGVKPSLVTNPSVVFRGIFNYRLNKISVGRRRKRGPRWYDMT